MTHREQLYFRSPQECIEYSRQSRSNTNPRYPTFCQYHYTAGDEQQFEDKRNRTHLRPSPVYTPNPSVYRKFQNTDCSSVDHTFKYMFYKFKKGIFVQIKDNRVSVFLPFSNYNFTNEFHSFISFDKSKYRSMNDVFRRACDINGRTFKPQAVNRRREEWFANNALIRYEYPVREFDSGISEMHDMLNEMCLAYTDIPDIELFINKRDHPLLRTDECEPYDCVFGPSTPLRSHKYNSYTPILSMCGKRSGFADVVIPTWDDWARVSSLESKYFIKCSQYYEPIRVHEEWSDKIPTAVFRGSSTGFGLTLDTNPRLRIAHMSLEGVCDDDGIRLLDAGIVSWNVRPRIHYPYIDTFEDSILRIPLVSPLTLFEQSRYKYIVHVDGHVAAYRLAKELGSMSVVLKVDSEFTLWFSALLQPWVHYVPVRSDLSDLYERIRWCKEHDAECQTIATNAKRLYDTHLQKRGILEYLRNTIITLKQCSRPYTYVKRVCDIVTQYERNLFEAHSIGSDTSIPFTPTHLPPSIGRCFSRCHGTQLFIQRYYATHGKLPLQSVRTVRVNKKTSLTIHRFGDDTLSEKTSQDDTETLNEWCVGTYCINPLTRFVPSFVFTYGIFNNHVYTEFVEGCTLFEYISSPAFSIQTFVLVMVQIALSLETAQNQCLFMHYDLYPWNIMLRTYPTPRDHTYTVGTDTYTINTDTIPVMIDFGKSRGVYKGRYYGRKYIFGFSAIHDLLCVLVSSLFSILNTRQCSKHELKVVFHLSSFFTRTRFTDYQHFDTVRSLKTFLMRHKKYGTMISRPKGELDTKTNMDFIRHAESLLSNGCVSRSTRTFHPNYGTPTIVFDYLCGRTDTSEWIRFYQSRLHTDCSVFEQCAVHRILQSLGQKHLVYRPPTNPSTQRSYVWSCPTPVPITDEMVEYDFERIVSMHERGNKYPGNVMELVNTIIDTNRWLKQYGQTPFNIRIEPRTYLEYTTNCIMLASLNDEYI